jgi:post-segregation antitoxin (ccd killing protein)
MKALVSVCCDPEVLKMAQELRINRSSTFEQALREAIKKKQKEGAT